MYIDETTHVVQNSTSKEGESIYRPNAYCFITCVDKITVYNATISRSTKWLREKLSKLDFKIYISSDAYTGYDFIDKDYHLDCNIHCRRNFFKALLVVNDENIEESMSYKIVKAYNAIFHRENELAKLSPEDRYKERNSKGYQKMIDELKSLIDQCENEMAKGTQLETAVKYALRHWDKLWNYRKSGHLKMENQKAELAVKYLALERKNSLFFYSDETAKINCNILTILLTAKAYGLDPHKYLNYVLHMIPDRDEEHKDNEVTKLRLSNSIRPDTVDYEEIAPWSNRLYTKPVDFPPLDHFDICSKNPIVIANTQ